METVLNKMDKIQKLYNTIDEFCTDYTYKYSEDYSRIKNMRTFFLGLIWWPIKFIVWWLFALIVTAIITLPLTILGDDSGYSSYNDCYSAVPSHLGGC